MEEGVCWAFNKVPSELPEFFWQVTRRDIKVKMNLRYGEESSRVVQDFQTTMKVAALALGGKPSEEVQPTNSLAEAKAAFASAFSRSGGSG